MDTRMLVSVWSLVFLSLFSLTPAGPAGRERTSPEDKESWEAYVPHNGVRHGNRVRKHNGAQTPLFRQQSAQNEPQDGDNDDNDDVRKAAQLWAEIEHKVLHHLRRTESRLQDQLEDTADKLNHSITINYLYKVYHYLIEEVEIGKQIGEMRAGEIEKVRKMALDQGKEVVKLYTTVDQLRQTLDNLTGVIQQLRGGGADPQTALTPPPPRLSTPPPLKPKFPADCQEVYQLGGMKYEGDYYIKIQPYLSKEPIDVCCRMKENAGWTLLQRRMDGSIDFYRDWNTYRDGFGEVRGEFWMGNDNIYHLTNQADYKLRIDMTDFDGREHYAEYDHFRTLNEDYTYKMHVHGYHGNAGDSLTPSWNNHDGQPFSTYDRDHDERFYDNCAERFHGAWWFRSCFESHLNGKYYHRGTHDNFFKQNGIQWNAVGHHYSLHSVVMMVKPNKNIQEVKQHDDHISNDIQ